MREALEFAMGKQLSPMEGTHSLQDGVSPPDYSADVQAFTDGTAVACLSCWKGLYSEVTPDIDAEPPQWWIFA